MKILFKILFILGLILISTLNYAQEKKSHLDVNINGWGKFNYYIDGMSVSSTTFKKQLSSDQLVSNMFRTGRTMSIAGNVVGCIGAFGTGYGLGTFIANGDGSTVLIAGAGVMVLGIVLHYIGNKKARDAVRHFNERTNLSLKSSGNELGICFSF